MLAVRYSNYPRLEFDANQVEIYTVIARETQIGLFEYIYSFVSRRGIGFRSLSYSILSAPNNDHVTTEERFGSVEHRNLHQRSD